MKGRWTDRDRWMGGEEEIIEIEDLSEREGGEDGQTGIDGLKGGENGIIMYPHSRSSVTGEDEQAGWKGREEEKHNLSSEGGVERGEWKMDRQTDRQTDRDGEVGYQGSDSKRGEKEAREVAKTISRYTFSLDITVFQRTMRMRRMRNLCCLDQEQCRRNAQKRNLGAGRTCCPSGKTSTTDRRSCQNLSEG